MESRGSPGRGLTAFTVTSVTDRQNGTPDITSLAVDATGRRVFLGLQDGSVEEHRLRPTPGGPGLTPSLVARKQLCKRAVVGLHFLPVGGGRLAVVSGEGGVLLADAQTLEAQAMPVRGAVLAAVETPPGGAPPRLAIATRPSKRALRVAVYEVAGEARGRSGAALVAQAEVPDSAPAVGSMAWVGGASLVLCCGARYLLVAPAPERGAAGRWRELLVVPEELASFPTAVAALPQLHRALLLMGGVGVGVDARGQPVGSSLQLGALPPLRALACSGSAVVCVCEDGMHVLELGGAEVEEVQVMGYGPGVKPAPGQPMFAASNAAGSCVAVAGRRKVWACLPVPPQDRARQLLARGDLRPAVAMVEEAARRGEPWAEAGSAQAALLLMHEGEFEGAASLLERCPPAVFQPAAELPPLFPGHAQPWAGRLPAPGRYWGLHPPLPSLRDLMERWRSRGPGRPGGSAAASLAGSWPGADGALAAGQGEEAGPPANGGSAAADEASRRLERAALDSLVHYLFRVRVMGGLACPDFVDTLLLHLLIDLGAVRQAAAFAAVPNQVEPGAVSARLAALGWHHALASLRCARGDAAGALSLWRSVVDGGFVSADPGVRIAEQREALESAVLLLQDGTACPEDVLLQYVPWLLAASQPDALRVLRARRLTPAAVLPLLPRDSDARWQYLEQYLGQGGAGADPDPALHTELAAELVAAVLRTDPGLRCAEGAAARPAARRRSSRGSKTAADLVGGLAAAGAASAPVAALRSTLLAHLESSPAVDHAAVLAALAGTALHEEAVVLQAKLGDHMAVLRLLALTLRDTAAAVAYATAHLPPSEYRALLALVLEPGQGRAPLYDDAAYLVAALGEHLDALEVVQALPPGMPLEAAVAIVAPILRDRTHRRRQGLVAKNLQRAALGAARAQRADAEAARVTIDDERACPHCHLRLGGKVFVVLRGVADGQAPAPAGQRQMHGAAAAAAAAAAAPQAAGEQHAVCCYNCYRRRL